MSDTTDGPALPRYVYIITPLTVAYLTVELAFNARLLDVVGGNTSPDVVTSIEHWGRSLSGAALTLAVWGMVIMPMAHRRRPQPIVLAGWLALSAAICGAGMWQLQKQIIDHIVERSTGSQRRTAAKLRVIERSAIEQNIEIVGIPLDAATMATPEGKSFLALLPFMASSVPNIERKIDPGMLALVNAGAERAVGGPAVMFDKFQASAEQIRLKYNLYAQASNDYADQIDGLGARANRAWAKYIASIGQRGLTPETVPRPAWPQIAADVRAQGAAVPRGWDPADRSTFDAAVIREGRARIDHVYRAKMIATTGEAMPIGLDRAAFEARSEVQRQWHRALKLEDHGGLSYALNGNDFMRIVYEPLIAQITARRMAQLVDYPADYIDGGSKAELGRSAMSALIVPPIALAFSLAGALLHIFKVTNFAGRILIARRGARRNETDAARPVSSPTLVIGLTVALVAMAAFMLPNAITRSRLYNYFENYMQQTTGPVPALMCRWVIQAQHYFWPLNETIRQHVLAGFKF